MNYIIAIFIFLISINTFAIDMIILKKYNCDIKNIEVYKSGYPKKYDEGYYPLQLIIKGKKITVGDLLIEQKIDGSLCSNIPIFKIDDSTILVVSSIDDRPFGSFIFFSLINTNTGKVLHSYKGRQFQKIFFKNKKIYFSTSISRSDSISGGEHSLNGKKYTFLEEEIHKVSRVDISKENKITIALDLKQTFQKDRYNYLFKSFTAFQKEFNVAYKDLSKDTWIYILYNRTTKKASCYHMTSKRKYYDDIENWKCL